MYCICNQVNSISYYVHQEPHLGVLHLLAGALNYHQVCCIFYHVNQEPHLGVLHLPSSVLHMPSSNIRTNTGVYYISHQVYCKGHALLQESHLSVLHILSCKSGTSLGILYLPHRCTAYETMYTRSLTWVYCICHLT